MLLNIKYLLNELPPLHFNTLKFHVEFFQEVVDHEPMNKMNSYNVAVTVGPNIFRPKSHKKGDEYKVGIFYDLLEKMIDNHIELFDKTLTCKSLVK